jgi:urea transport system permease protein
MAIRLLRLIAILVTCLLIAVPAARAQGQATPQMVDALGQGGFSEREAAIVALVATGDERVVTVLQALLDNNLFMRKTDAKVVIATKSGGALALTDPLEGADLGAATSSDVERVKVNNSLRGKLRTAIGQLTLMNPDPVMRLSAAENVLKNADPGMLELLDKAIAAETDAHIKSVMQLARAVIVLKTDASVDEKRQAIAMVTAQGTRDALTVLTTALASSRSRAS